MKIKSPKSNALSEIPKMMKATRDNMKFLIDLYKESCEQFEKMSSKIIAQRKEQDDLLSSLQKLQANQEQLILRIPTGEFRNRLCDENIEALALIERLTPTKRIKSN